MTTNKGKPRKTARIVRTPATKLAHLQKRSKIGPIQTKKKPKGKAR